MQSRLSPGGAMKGQYSTFVIRIPNNTGAPLRGMVRHIGTQEEAHFDSYEEMKKFIIDHLNLPCDEPDQQKKDKHIG
jgi:hypothetical protein